MAEAWRKVPWVLMGLVVVACGRSEEANRDVELPRVIPSAFDGGVATNGVEPTAGGVGIASEELEAPEVLPPPEESSERSEPPPDVDVAAPPPEPRAQETDPAHEEPTEPSEPETPSRSDEPEVINPDVPEASVDRASSPDERPSEAPREVMEPAPSESEAELAMELPEGLEFDVVLDVRLSTSEALPGDAVFGRVAEDILADDGMVWLPLGARLKGVVLESSGAHDGRGAQLALSIDSVLIEDEWHAVQASVTEMELQEVDDTLEKAAKVGVGAAAGALLGRLLGDGRDDAVKGAVVGAVAGAVVASATDADHLELREGTTFTVRLDAPLRVQANSRRR